MEHEALLKKLEIVEGQVQEALEKQAAADSRASDALQQLAAQRKVNQSLMRAKEAVMRHLDKDLSRQQGRKSDSNAVC